MARQFGASATTIAWVATSYLLSVAVCILVSGWLGDSDRDEVDLPPRSVCERSPPRLRFSRDVGIGG
jgi:MFS family permease